MKKTVIAGAMLAILGYVLSIVSEATQDSALMVSYVTGGLELLLYLISVPLVHRAGKKTRRESNAAGSPGLRLAGWIMYGVAIPHALLFFNWGLVAAGNNRVPSGQIAVNSAVFFVAAMLMIADAWSSIRLDTST